MSSAGDPQTFHQEDEGLLSFFFGGAYLWVE